MGTVLTIAAIASFLAGFTANLIRKYTPKQVLFTLLVIGVLIGGIFLIGDLFEALNQGLQSNLQEQLERTNS